MNSHGNVRSTPFSRALIVERRQSGESTEIRTWLGEVRGPRFDRHVDIRKPGARRLSARATTEWCRIDRATRRPMRINGEVLDLFRVPGWRMLREYAGPVLRIGNAERLRIQRRSGSALNPCA